MRSDKKMAIMITTIMVISAFALVMPVSAQNGPPEPVELWNYPTSGNVTDIALGHLDGNPGDDVAAIDDFLPPDTLHAISGSDGTQLWQDLSMAGYAVAVGDITGDGVNEVIAGGSNGTAWVINAYDKDGNILWSYPVMGKVKDIEIGDIDDDGIDDVVACNVFASVIYAINGTGHDIEGEWPVTTGTPVVDLAVGQLDGEDGMDVTAIGTSVPGCLYVYNSTGGEMWSDHNISGRTVEIGDVDGDGDNEVVAGTVDGVIYIYFFGSTPEVVTINVGSPEAVMDIELGDLDGDAGKEIAAITNSTYYDHTLLAIDFDTEWNPTILWTYPISWDTNYFGESLAIGDVDRDYKNEVIAAGGVSWYVYSDDGVRQSVIPTGQCIYAFDGLDNDGDGFGDLVWSPYCVWECITDVEVGDLDGDGDDDVAFGIKGGETIYALAKVENKDETTTGTGPAYFDSDPSTLEDLTPIDESDLPEEGKPNLVFPHGFFSFNITGLTYSQNATVTITFPEDIPIGAQYWKYGPNGSTNNPQPERWYRILIGDDDGDNVITIQLTDGGIGDDDGVANGVIVDQGGIGNPRAEVPALTPVGIAALVGLLAIIATSTLVRKRRKR